MSSNNVAHVSSVDKGLKMKIKRTKGPTKVDPKHEVVKPGEQTTTPSGISSGQQQQHQNPLSTIVPSSTNSLPSSSSSSSSSPLTNSSLSAATTNTLLLSSSSSSSLFSVSTNSSPFLQQSSSSSSVASSVIASTVSASASSIPLNDTASPLIKGNLSSDSYLSTEPHWVGTLNKSPLKSWNVGSGSASTSSVESPATKDGKSPKLKAAYSKKATEAKSAKATLTGSVSIAASVGNASNGANSNVTSFTSSPIADIKKPVAGGSAVGGPGSTMLSSTSASSSTANPSSFSANARVLNSGLSLEPRPGDTVHVKRENPVHDPYEFNAKVEDKIELPPKKLKIDKPDYTETALSPHPSHHHHNQQQQQQHLAAMQQQSSGQQPSSQQQPHMYQHRGLQQQQLQHHQQQTPALQKRSVSVETCSTGTVTDPECLGPCEPGSSVRLEGIVWKETDNGLLVVNVTWRGKTYMGTLMDSTRYAWAPPRPGGCESPVSDFESRTPKGRGKRTSRNSAAACERLPEGRRLRKGRRGTVNSSSSNFTAPPSPAKSEAGSGKRKVRGDADSSGDRSGKRSRSCSRGGGAESPAPTPPASSDAYIVCPEPNCHKKYKHMNGLRYHRTHAHRKSSITEDGKEDAECDDEEEEKIDKKERAPLSERAERMKAKEKRSKETKRGSDRDSKDSLDDDIPLKDLANKVASSSRPSDSSNGGKDKDEAGKCLDSTVVSALTANSKIDPHVVLTKTTVHLHTESQSLPGINSTASKSKDTLDVPSVPLSTSLSTGAITPTSLPSSSSSSTLSSSNSALASSVPFNSSNSESGQGHLALSGSITVASNNNSNSSMPVMTTLKSPITSQVYQISPTGCLGGVTLVSAQTNPSLSLVSAQTFPLTTSTSPSPLATASSTTTSVLGTSVSVSDRQGKQGSHITSGSTNAVRTVSNARPIAPAPVPGFQSAPGSSLKAIQPKPQTGGDYSSNVSASLADLNKEKVRKSKKKRSENKDSPSSLKGHGQNNSDIVSRDDDRISSNHVMKGPSDLPSSSNVDMTDPQSASDAAFRQRIAASPSPDVVGSGAGGGLRPSFLPVTPGGSDMRSTVNDDVHSPAYSDISDANDTGSPTQRDSPEKKEVSGGSLTTLKKENQMNGSPHLGPEGGPPPNSLSGHYGGMYYFGGPPGYLPHGLSPQSMASPTVKREGVSMEDGTPSNPEDGAEKKDGARAQQQQRAAQSPHQMPSGNENPENMQQKNLISYYAHLHGVSPAAVQYQYNMAAHPPTPLDHFHQALAAQQDPLLRQHLLEQHQKQQQQHQQRLFHQHEAMSSAASVGGPDASGKRTPSSALNNTSFRPQGGVSSPLDKLNSSQGLDGSSEHKRFPGPDDREQALRDKQHENHQILKENIELKSQIGQHQLLLELQHQQQVNYRLIKQQQEHHQHQKPPQPQPNQSDMIRAQMFQQQKQKIFDNQRPDIRKLPPELTTGQPLHRLPTDLKPEDLLSSDKIKKEPRSDSGYDGIASRDAKRFDIKEEIPASSVIDHAKSSRPSSQSGIAGAGLPSSTSLPSSLAMSTTPSPSPLNAGTPVSLVSAIPGPPPPPGFPYSPYYAPPGAFRPMQLDPGHPMYRALNPHIIGYAGGPPHNPFLHPSQLGFRLPSDLDMKAAAGDVKSPLIDSTMDGKPAPGAPGLGVRPTTPLHKIHELQEKGRHPSPGVNSPAPLGKSSGAEGEKRGGETLSSSTSSSSFQEKGSTINSSNNNNNNDGGANGSSGKDKQRDYASSPPTQRHVHTHHHTHVVGGFPPLYPPDAYSAMFSHPAAAAAAAASIGTAAHPFPPAQPPPTAPKS